MLLKAGLSLWDKITVMFSLFYGLWNYVFSKTEFHVLILGVDKAGKTVIFSVPTSVFI